MKKELKLKRMCLSPIVMGLSVMLMAVGVSGLQAGSKPLENEVIDVIYGLSGPTGVVVSANNKYIFVTEYSNNTLAVIDAATHQIIDNAIFAGTEPFGVALTPNGKTLYVANDGGAFGFATNSFIQTQSLSTTHFSSGLAVSPNGKGLYVVASADPGLISVFETAGAGKFVTNIDVGNDPIDVAFTPNGKTAYVTNSFDSTVSVIDVKTNSTGSPITGLDHPYGINITPNGETAYVLNLDGVGVINTKTNTVTASIDLSSYGNGTGYFMGLTPDGKYLYVPVNKYPASKGNLVVINTATNLVTNLAPAAQLGDFPTAIAISPNGKYAYVTDTVDGTLTVIAISGD